MVNVMFLLTQAILLLLLPEATVIRLLSVLMVESWRGVITERVGAMFLLMQVTPWLLSLLADRQVILLRFVRMAGWWLGVIIILDNVMFLLTQAIRLLRSLVEQVIRLLYVLMVG